ncbi:MAG: bifunctional GTP diphosphokinase/guanosine-3',5'-bis pyrophosphate 3'-pyrophosphohydrolase [Gammaproteobacteria bacterium]|nr:MAG: bifunctional GTP diphosphokinase/guanosine-3',5'-bis pyrophosphate 3'-pyrophosphohydrolase [Gammaproteobacteria bacterium]
MASKQQTVADNGSRYLISDLCSMLESYLEPEQVQEVYRAYLFGAEAHEGQHRVSGEPYIYHPVEAARILAELGLDHKSIIAAILHDVIEDTGTAKDQIESEFGNEVAELVDGVSKLTQIEFESQAEAQAENFRKMILAMVRDIRVIMVKLADRLHNMRTLGVMRPDKRRRIARETLEIYAPIANRLGINAIRVELEDLGFAALYPLRYKVLEKAVREARGHRKEVLKKIETSIKRRMRQEKLTGRILSREKHLYSLYRKIRDKTLSFDDIYDVYAFRIVVDRVDTCYRVLGMMHNLYKPVPGKFKDYIAIPKANGYQSLHTILFGPYGVPIEVQIRTEEMDKVAESGVAAHWLYKSGDRSMDYMHAGAREWLRELLEMQKHAGNPVEFLENVKIDLFPDAVYVFTPAGEIMKLPHGATLVDFAYAVHTDVGNTCIAAKVDRQLVPLRTQLTNGQTVEIVTAEGAHPSPAWLSFVVSAKARSNIRHYQKNLKNEEAVGLGRRMLDRALGVFDADAESISKKRLSVLLKEYNLRSFDDLLVEVGMGRRPAVLVARALVPADQKGIEAEQDERAMRPLVIKGTEGLVMHFAKCCRPIPGDPVVGIVTKGRGMVIHTETCRNLTEHKHPQENCLDVQWEPGVDEEFPVEISAVVADRRGVLATVAAAIGDCDSNIENVGIEERDGLTNTLMFTITVHNRKHLAEVMRRVRNIPSVMRITRLRN